MSAKDQMRAMLDQLMGTTRDGNYNRRLPALWFIYIFFCKRYLYFR
jgi:hypothetical protein